MGDSSMIASPTTMLNATADINIRTNNFPLSPASQRKNMFNRTFGKLEKGSLRGSIFSLCAAAIGSGVLSLPYVLALTGWVIGTVLIVVGAIAACWSLFLIADGASKARVPNLNTLAKKAGGNKLMILL
jgi:hypothetical protein